MKNTEKQPLVLMTTKKGTKKGTRKVYMLDIKDMSTIDVTDNVTAILYDTDIPAGVSGMIKGGIMVVNPARVLIDPIHLIKEITLDELNAIQAADYVDALDEVTETKAPSFLNPADVLADISKDIKKHFGSNEPKVSKADKSDINEMFKQAFNGRSITEVEAAIDDKSPEEVKAFLTQSFKDIGVDVAVKYVGKVLEVLRPKSI